MSHAEVLQRFLPNEDLVSCERIGNGHINKTYLGITAKGEKYILQQINTYAFKDVDLLMNNIDLVTKHLADKNVEIIRMLRTTSNCLYTVTETGSHYRTYKFIDNTETIEKPSTLKTVRDAAKAFGKFHKDLADFDASLLGEIIPHFHDTPKRYNDLQEAIKNDVKGRRCEVQREIDIVNKYVDILPYIVDGIKSGEVGLHITHNDPKINNVLFDINTHELRSIIDLDTVMPGSVLYDFGDALRSMFVGDNESSRDYTKVEVNFDIYRNYLEAYYEEAKSFLTPKEIELFPYAPFILTIECGIRFLEDYLKGDVYFNIHEPDDNLARCRVHLNLCESIIKNIDELKRITSEVVRK